MTGRMYPVHDRFGVVAWLIVPAVALVVIVVGLWPSESPANPEARAHALAVSLKCPICAGESIAASQTDLAEDLRRLIANEIADGSTDEEILALFVDSYGEQVLLDPPEHDGVGQSVTLIWFDPWLNTAAAAHSGDDQQRQQKA